ncbi:DNA mismatch repair protein MutS [Alteriqipengyuania sp.]|uniref:DNA mismatch repair protein MutS n=1 Tax=Alteriqipengyuania sp. TaxID=2800692 RepID=UPI00351464DA
MTARLTPMMEQYHALKREAGECLLFYRMGDFFELFFDDAKVAAGVLDIALTSRGESGGEAVPMCGVPVHSADGYLARLIRAGHRVAIAEQVETPDEAKARAKAEGKPSSKVLVARQIIRFVTAGTLTEDALLEPRSANRLAAVCEVRGTVGIAACDISTGRMELEECAPDGMAAALSRIGAREIVVPEGWEQAPADATERPASDFASERGRQRLQELHGVATLDAFGNFERAMLSAAGGLLAYIDHAGRGTMPFLLPPTVTASDAVMAIDEASRSSLEIVSTQAGARSGSLLGTVDRCVTSAGARLLAEDLSAPLARKPDIEARLHLVRFFHEDPILRSDTREALRAIPDVARALARLVADRGSPRDLGQVRDGLAQARELHAALSRLPDRPALLVSLLPALTGHAALVSELSQALVPSPPTERSNGGFIASGYDAALDALRETSGDARKAIAAMEARYRSETGISSLKIKHNGVLGYFIEVPARHGDALMGPDSGFTHRQTMANAVRFNSVHLHEEASRISEAAGRALAAEEAHFEALVAAVVDAREAVAPTADALARIDVAAGLAERAAEGDWCAPQIDEAPCLDIVGGRHPVVEAALAKAGERFVPNDCKLSDTDHLWLIGGPNMGGKSTFLRANALIVLLAQAGSYVPAKSAQIGLVDRLFSRVGASDNLARGRSTFMVEMVETAAILAQATERSFVILDEVGRGTSTYDGLALAWAVAEAIHETNRCRCLFATHYHELARLADTCDALSLHHVRAREWQGDLVLLHEVTEGPADRSYGLAVAKLAGVPKGVVDRASAVLKKLEKGREETGGLAAGLGDLPLFSAAMEAEQEECDTLRDRLSALDLDALSPREALEILYDLKREASES